MSRHSEPPKVKAFLFEKEKNHFKTIPLDLSLSFEDKQEVVSNKNIHTIQVGNARLSLEDWEKIADYIKLSKPSPLAPFSDGKRDKMRFVIFDHTDLSEVKEEIKKFIKDEVIEVGCLGAGQYSEHFEQEFGNAKEQRKDSVKKQEIAKHIVDEKATINNLKAVDSTVIRFVQEIAGTDENGANAIIKKAYKKFQDPLDKAKENLTELGVINSFAQRI